jgi:arginyl-tRNA synthetase
MEISKKVKENSKLEQKVFELLRNFEQGDKATVVKFKKITKTCVDGQRNILSELGITYDKFDYESDFILESRKILEKLKSTKKLHLDSDGRFYLDQTGTKVENKMKSPVLVLTRSDQTGLYPLRDLAYSSYKSKISKNNFIILGEDQKLYLEQLSEALKLIKVSPPIPIHYSFILLAEKGKSKKMSTRKGDVVLLEDFLEKAINKAKKEISKRKTPGNPKEVGISAVKYSILKNHPNKMILFNLDDALSFEGDTGPYLLYSYARASSILRKSKSKVKNDFKISELKNKEIELVKKLSEFPKIIESSYKNLNPSYLANYSYQLSKSFNEFYHECPVIGYDNEEFRIAVVQSFRIILKKCLNLLGINVIEMM